MNERNDSMDPDADRTGDRLATVAGGIITCRRCPRLVDWREGAPERAPARFRGSEYWARPVPGFGDPSARIYVLGLAPSAHGGTRTGRSFTGNPTAEWLVAALHRAGLANQATSMHRADGLRLRGVWLGSAVRCAPPRNRPTRAERDACLPFLRAELAALAHLRVILALGQFAWSCAQQELVRAPHVRFAHGAEQPGDALTPTLVASYHPSRQNTNTGRLTRTMLADVPERAMVLAEMRSRQA